MTHDSIGVLDAPHDSANRDGDFRWTDEFVLGYNEMDDVHREFFDVVSQLLHSTDAAMLDALDRFAAHARDHFGTEDRWMSETDFPPRDCHIGEHAAVMESAAGVRERVSAGDYAIGRSFARELVRWFPGHAQHLDSALAHWMFKRSYGGKPVVLRRNGIGVHSTVPRHSDHT